VGEYGATGEGGSKGEVVIQHCWLGIVFNDRVIEERFLNAFGMTVRFVGGNQSQDSAGGESKPKSKPKTAA